MNSGGPILIVDDLPEVAGMYQHYLEERSFRVTTAHDGVSAIEAIKLERPRVIIVDLVMPRLSGWQLIQLLKRDPKRCEIPVIALSGQDAKASAEAAGADSYLAKPCSPSQLEAEVLRLLGV
jgi:twitching motility two-component system response regulator PilH